MTKLIKCPHCGASGYIVGPAWYNNQKGFIARGIGKTCPKTKEYATAGWAKRAWNQGLYK